MEIQLVTMDELREHMAQLDRPGFMERYQGAFLLAMGFLEVEEIEKERRKVMPARVSKIDATESMSFGTKLRHVMTDSHPLAGCAFFFRPRGDAKEVELGRGMDCDITIPDSSVSETHCFIKVDADGVKITDRGSTNGTSVNLEKLTPDEPALLADEDIISIGRYSFQLLISPSLYRELEALKVLDEWVSDHPSESDT